MSVINITPTISTFDINNTVNSLENSGVELIPVDNAVNSLQHYDRGYSSLQTFQSHISARIAQAKLDQTVEHSLLSVHVKRYRLLIPLIEINELLTPPTITTVPLAKQWILGLAVARAEVIAIFDLNVCLSALLSEKIAPVLSMIQSSVFISPKTSDNKCVLLSSSVATQLAFIADKIQGTLNPEKLGYTDILQDVDILNTINNSLNNNRLNTLNYPHFLKKIWKDTDGYFHFEISLMSMIHSQEFINLTY